MILVRFYIEHCQIYGERLLMIYIVWLQLNKEVMWVYDSICLIFNYLYLINSRVNIFRNYIHIIVYITEYNHLIITSISILLITQMNLGSKGLECIWRTWISIEYYESSFEIDSNSSY